MADKRELQHFLSLMHQNLTLIETGNIRELSSSRVAKSWQTLNSDRGWRHNLIRNCIQCKRFLIGLNITSDSVVRCHSHPCFNNKLRMLSWHHRISTVIFFRVLSISYMSVEVECYAVCWVWFICNSDFWNYSLSQKNKWTVCSVAWLLIEISKTFWIICLGKKKLSGQISVLLYFLLTFLVGPCLRIKFLRV